MLPLCVPVTMRVSKLPLPSRSMSRVPTVDSEALAVASARLAEDEVVRAEELPERASAHGVHRARLEIHEDRARNVAAARRLIEDGFGDGGRGGTLQLEAGCSASFTRMAQIAWLMTRPIFHVNVESENCKWASLKYTLMRSSCRSESPWYVPVGSMPCSSEITCKNRSASSWRARLNLEREHHISFCS